MCKFAELASARVSRYGIVERLGRSFCWRNTVRLLPVREYFQTLTSRGAPYSPFKATERKFGSWSVTAIGFNISNSIVTHCQLREEFEHTIHNIITPTLHDLKLFDNFRSGYCSNQLLCMLMPGC